MYVYPSSKHNLGLNNLIKYITIHFPFVVFIVEHDKEHNTRVGEGETKYHGGWGYVLILGRGTTRGECQLAIRGEGLSAN